MSMGEKVYDSSAHILSCTLLVLSKALSPMVLDEMQCQLNDFLPFDIYLEP